jgi:hypothetical protein
VTPVAKALPFFPARDEDDPAERAALNAAAHRLLEDALQGDELHAARVSMAERRLREGFTALEEAERRLDAADDRATLAPIYHQAVSAYEEISRQHPAQAKRVYRDLQGIPKGRRVAQEARQASCSTTSAH